MSNTINERQTVSSNGTKGERTIYWICTAIIFVADGLGAFGSNQPEAIKGIHHLGFPDYFRWELAVGKILGGFFLILPFVPNRLKEWSYVGFGISLITAAIGNYVMGGPMANTYSMMAVVFFGILLTSYIYFHKTYGRYIYKR